MKHPFAWFNYLHLFVLYSVILACFLSFDILSRAAIKLGMQDRPELSDYYSQILEYHKRMDSAVPKNSVIFIGDSLTQGFPVSAAWWPSTNYGIGADTTYGVINRLEQYTHSIANSQAVVLAIGINDLKIRDNQETVSYTHLTLPTKA